MRVTTEELRKATALLLDHLERKGSRELEIAEDYYWDVPADRRYDPYQEPKELSLGQLSDDWREIQKLLDGSGEPVGYALVWLAAILRRAGEKATG